MSTPSITALITIREKEIQWFPTYDFYTLGGKPLYRHMLDRLLAVPQISRIVVTTDSEGVKSECASNGKIRVVDYPSDFSEDANMRFQEQQPWSDKMTAHALKQVEGEHFIQLHCGTPFLPAASIENAIVRYYDSVLGTEYGDQFDSVMSLGRVDRKLYMSENYPVIKLRDEPPFVVFEDAILNVFNRKAFNKNGQKKFGKNPMFFETREVEGLSIESEDAFTHAEVIYENRNRFPFIYQG